MTALDNHPPDCGRLLWTVSKLKNQNYKLPEVGLLVYLDSEIITCFGEVTFLSVLEACCELVNLKLRNLFYFLLKKRRA